MRTGRKQRKSVHQQSSCMAEALERRQLLASVTATNPTDVDIAPEWSISEITISNAPAGAMATSALVSWKIDANFIGNISYAFAGPNGYASNVYSDLLANAYDPDSGYLETSQSSRTFALPAGTPVNGLWQFGAMDSSWWGGRIDQWSVTIYYDAPLPAPEIEVRGLGININDGDTTPSSADGTDFGIVNLGATAVSRTFVVSNVGSDTLTLGSVSVPAGYTITQNLPSSIAVNGSANLTVALGTGTAGTFAGDISFGTNDSNENPFNFRITGIVRAVNLAPTNITLSSNTIAENQPSGTTIGTFTATDPNPGDTFTYMLVGGIGATDNSSFSIAGNQLRSNAVFDYEAKNSYSIRVQVRDQGGLSFEKVFTITVTDVDEIAPTVSASSINDGATQRSMVKKLTVTFSEPVTLAADGLQVKLQSGAAPANTTVTVTNPLADQRTYVLSFSGTGAVGNSLADGIYDLIASATGVHDLAGNVMTGNYTRRFHRLFGDADGNKVVNALDYAKLKATYGRSSVDPLFNSGFDYESNNVINALDLAQFRKRYGMIFSY